MFRRFIGPVLFQADSGGAAAGGGPAPTPAAPAAPATPTGDATGAPAAASSAQPAQQAEKTFTQAELDQIVKDRLARAQDKAQKDAEKTRQEAEAQALTAQGEFKTLAEQRAARVAELEPKAAQVERYEKALQAQVFQLRAGLPDHLSPLLDRMDVAEQLEYLVANRAKLVAAPAVVAPTPAPNINGGAAQAPAAASTPQREEEIRRRFRISK